MNEIDPEVENLPIFCPLEILLLFESNQFVGLFLYYILYDFNADLEREYYLMKTKKALESYNADPANNPPLKDEFGNKVVFP